MKTIALLTSGGDAPGMNAAVRAVVRTAHAEGIKVLGIRRGYHGLLGNDIYEMSPEDVNGITAKGGTILYTARSKEFNTPEGVAKGAAVCRNFGIEGLVTIGGDGTFRGALDLAREGIPAIGIPATIDNDIACTNYSIGFDTAANTAIDAIDKLRDTMQSHERCSIVEVMGRHAGYLAVYVGIAVGANIILVPEHDFDFDEDVVEPLRAARLRGHKHSILIVAEGVASAHELAPQIAEKTGLDPRLTVLGHIQRGGAPNARDRVTASRMGHYAVELLLAGKTKRVIGTQGGDITDFDIEEGLARKREFHKKMYDTAMALCKS